jgi:hypothetical protein
MGRMKIYYECDSTWYVYKPLCFQGVTEPLAKFQFVFPKGQFSPLSGGEQKVMRCLARNYSCDLRSLEYLGCRNGL